jgi:hypothetical protein
MTILREASSKPIDARSVVSLLSAAYAFHVQSGATRLPPTSPDLLDPAKRPYFLWWTECTVGEFREKLADPDARARAYWLGALLREANTRDVWLFTDVETIRRSWPFILPYLGKSRAMWAWLLGESAIWPPPEAV